MRDLVHLVWNLKKIKKNEGPYLLFAAAEYISIFYHFREQCLQVCNQPVRGELPGPLRLTVWG